MTPAILCAEYLALTLARRWGSYGYEAADRIADLTGLDPAHVDHLLARASLAGIQTRRAQLDAITCPTPPRGHAA